MMMAIMMIKVIRSVIPGESGILRARTLDERDLQINIGWYSEGILRKRKYDSGNNGHNLIQQKRHKKPSGDRDKWASSVG